MRQRRYRHFVQLVQVHCISALGARRHVGDLALATFRTYRNRIVAICNGPGTQRHAVVGVGLGVRTHGHAVGTEGGAEVAHRGAVVAARPGFRAQCAGVVARCIGEVAQRSALDAIGLAQCARCGAVITSRDRAGTKRRRAFARGLRRNVEPETRDQVRQAADRRAAVADAALCVPTAVL